MRPRGVEGPGGVEGPRGGAPWRGLAAPPRQTKDAVIVSYRPTERTEGGPNAESTRPQGRPFPLI